RRFAYVLDVAAMLFFFRGGQAVAPGLSSFPTRRSSDLPLQVRGRVMGTIQTAFSASQVMGLPLGVILSSRWGWHAPFMMILAVGVPVGLVIAARLQPIAEHLKAPSTRKPLRHVGAILSQGRYLRTFLATTMLTTG